MLGLHSLSRQAVRLGIAVGGLAAAAACGDNTISGPTLDLNLSRVAGFHSLKTALINARKEANGGFDLDMWPPSWIGTASWSRSCSREPRPPTSGRAAA